MSLEDRLSASPVVEVARRRSAAPGLTPGSSAAPCATPPSGAEVTDLDLAVAGDPGTAAEALAARGSASTPSSSRPSSGPGASSPASAAGRSTSPPCAAAAIEADLGERDFSVGAVAVPLAGGEPIDPYGGLADLERRRAARGRPRAASPPTRCACCGRRGSRPSSASRSTPAPSTLARAAGFARPPTPPASASSPSCASCSAAPTRCAASPCSTSSALTAGRAARSWTSLRGVEQGPNHHLDVHGHTLAVLEQDAGGRGRPRPLRRRARRRGRRALLDEPLADEMSRGTALRFGALFHDIGKPATRAERDGFVGFSGHDREGAEIVGAICAPAAGQPPPHPAPAGR